MGLAGRGAHLQSVEIPIALEEVHGGSPAGDKGLPQGLVHAINLQAPDGLGARGWVGMKQAAGEQRWSGIVMEGTRYGQGGGIHDVDPTLHFTHRHGERAPGNSARGEDGLQLGLIGGITVRHVDHVAWRSKQLATVVLCSWREE